VGCYAEGFSTLQFYGPRASCQFLALERSKISRPHKTAGRIITISVLHSKDQDKFLEPDDSKTLQRVGWRPPNQLTQKMANVINIDKIRKKKGKHILCYGPEYFIIVDMEVLHSHDQPDVRADSLQ
jgi:hypothetical protein